MVPRWAVVDKLVHELGSLRAVVQELETDAEVADTDVGLELRNSLARAADTVHLVIGGDDTMVTRAWKTIAEAQEVGARARAALQQSRAAGEDSRALRGRVQANTRQTAQHIKTLRNLRQSSAARQPGNGTDEEPAAAPPSGPRPAPARPRAR